LAAYVAPAPAKSSFPLAELRLSGVRLSPVIS
jgi:hypothetical protein